MIIVIRIDPKAANPINALHLIATDLFTEQEPPTADALRTQLL